MSIIIDLQYVNLVGSRLERFKQLRSRLWVCKCPYCLDDTNKKVKLKMYFYQSHKGGTSDHLSVHCHRCNYSNPFGAFLKEFEPTMYEEYRLEVFKERFGTQTIQSSSEPQKPAIEPVSPLPEPVVQLPLPTIRSLPQNHPAKLYVQSRKLPDWTHDLLQYSENFKQDFCEFSTEASLMKLPEDARLIIPFYDENHNLTMIQGRALDPKCDLRYITLKKDETNVKIFGLDRVDKTKTVLCVEGPIDSLFLPNAIASCDSNLLTVEASIYIYDFEPRSREIMNGLKNAIERGKRVVIPPDGFQYKDINEAVIGGMTSRDLITFIAKHTYQGLAARMRFSKYCSIKL